ncbi:hypothetical protein JCM10213v2_008321 [Rhodosporidiobolus nylandii]
MGDEPFVDLFVGFCSKLKIQDEDVCEGAVGQQAPIMAHALRSIELESPAMRSFCSTVFGLCPLQDVTTRRMELPPLPVAAEPTLAAEEGQRLARRDVAGGVGTFKVVHISDSHVDREYVAGTEANCTKVICCRNYDAGSTGPDVVNPASLFGEPKCDAPPSLLQTMFDAVELYAPDRSFTIFTGDAVDDAVWEVTEESVTEDLHLWAADLASLNVSASSGEVNSTKPPSYPVIGNHDVAPVNGFPLASPPTSNSSAQWVYDASARDWEKWIGSEAAEQVRTLSGCYSRVHPGTNLRIISVNTNYWYKQNFWLYDRSIPDWDPMGILTWLAQELDAAEKAGERAWILGHMPPGKADTLIDQSNLFDQIIQRYHRTIAAHFYGHSHAEEWEIAYPDYDQRTVENANGGNPVFRVYEVHNETYDVLDFTAYYTNLSASSFQTSPERVPYYSARKDYGSYLDPPHPDDAPLNATFWHRVTEVLEADDDAFQLFNARLTRGGSVKKCKSRSCKAKRICMLRALRSQDGCNVITPKFSFRRRKRDLDALSLPEDEDEEQQHLDAVGHDHHACEGSGLGEMLRKLASGEVDETVAGWSTVAKGGALAKRGETSALVAFRLEAHAAVERHGRAKRKRWWRFV